MSCKSYCILCLILCALSVTGRAQGQVLSRLDSLDIDSFRFTKSRFIDNIFHQAVNSVQKDPEVKQEGKGGKSEDPYLRYQGKIIRHIYIDPLGFDRSIDDTAARDNSLGARLGNRLHYTTKKFVIKDNLFIKENTPLNAYKVADNERYLRTLEYLRDARIVVKRLKHNRDSVDLIIYTKDFFSIAGGASSQLLNHIHLDLYETNLAGMAQRVEFTGLYDYNRAPELGLGGLYRKGNLFHTFIDGTVAYSTMSNNSFTREEETSKYLSLSKRLVSPYSRTAGGLTLSRNEAYNLYNAPDTQFFKYAYDLFDVWAGYNLGIRQLTATNNTIRDRRFLAFRYINRSFHELPTQLVTKYDPIYNSSQMVLAQITFFRQDYYKTSYIYGFGTTEDVPYGYNIAVAAGWQKQLDLERPYAGLKVSQYIVTRRGDFIQLFLKTGGFLYKDKVQDGSLLIGATGFSRIYFWNTTKIRQYVNASYTHLYNRVTYPYLRLDNNYGLRGFLSDSAYGTRRLSIQLETEFYLKKKILGFHFAPFPYADFTIITPQNGPYTKSSLYTSIGGGVRVRNENLVFQTIEVRAYYFPVAPTKMVGFKVIVTPNVRFRYSSEYVSAPDVIQLNAE